MLITNWVLRTFHRIVTHDAYRHGFEFPYMLDPKHDSSSVWHAASHCAKALWCAMSCHSCQHPSSLCQGCCQPLWQLRLSHILVVNEVLCTTH